MKEICPNLHNKQVAKEFGELKDLFGEDTAYLLWSKNNGYSIDKAPNGADSILFGELLHIANGDRTQALILKAKVYSDEFFKWFGDWTSEDKENVSKVVDKNGEPQVTYHTVNSKYSPNFKKFDTNIEGFKTAIYHTDSITMSSTYNDVTSYILSSFNDATLKKYSQWYTDSKRTVISILNNVEESDFKDKRNFDWFNNILKKKIIEAINSGNIKDAEDCLLKLDGLFVEYQDPNVPFKLITSVYEDIIGSFYNFSDIHNNANPEKYKNTFENNLYNNIKIDYLNIKNPKVIDAYGHNWSNIHEKKYYDISDKLDKIKDRLSDDFYSSIDGEYDSKSNFNDIVYRIIHLYNTTQAKAVYKNIVESRYLSSLFKGISEDDLIYYAKERQKALSTRDLEKTYLTTDYSDA